MSLSKRNKKRILIFLFVPLLIAAIILSNDYYVQIPIGILLSVYVGFIIFLRDSVHSPQLDPVDVKLSSPPPHEPESIAKEGKFYDGDEGFEVVPKGGKSASKETFFEETEVTEEALQEYKKIISEKTGEKDADELTSVIKQILKVIRESLSVTSAVFFIYDPEKEKISLFAAETGVNEKSIIERKFPVENDIVSKIAVNNRPDILSHISPNVELDNLRYYTQPQGIKSFCGVPYDYNGQLSFILAVDSKGDNEFGNETIYILGRYVRLIAVLISLFEENHNKKVSETRLNALLSLISIEKPFESVDEMLTFFARISEKLLNWDLMAFVSYKSSDRKFKVSKIKNKNIPARYVGEGYEIELEKSAVGKAIKKGDTVYLPDVTASASARFNSNEKISTEGSFLVVPLVFDGQNFGAIAFEALKKNAYSKQDIAFIKKAVKLFAYYVYSFTSQNYLRGLISLDPATLVLNKKEFNARLQAAKEYEKICGKYGILIFIKVDMPDEQRSLFDDKVFPKVLKTIAEYIKEELKGNSFIGKYDSRTFSVYFFNWTINDATVWAEKLRKKIAQSGYAGLSNQVRYTVSIGIATTREKDLLDKIYHDAALALEKAEQSGGNKVISGN